MLKNALKNWTVWALFIYAILDLIVGVIAFARSEFIIGLILVIVGVLLLYFLYNYVTMRWS